MIYDNINLYNKNGEIVDNFKLPEKCFNFPEKRLSQGFSGRYYKGSGCFYRKHLIYSETIPSKDVYKTFDRHMGYKDFYFVEKSCFLNKFGIFEERYEPYNDEVIGGVGYKDEHFLIENSIKLKDICSVRVLDELKFHGHSIFVNEYDERRSIDGYFIEDRKFEECVRNIIEYKIYTFFDKHLSSDVGIDGKLHDPADLMFIENDYETMTSLYALYVSFYGDNYDQFIQKMESFGFLNREDKIDKRSIEYLIPLMVVLTFNKFYPEKIKNLFDVEKIIKEYNLETYKHLLENFFLKGKSICEGEGNFCFSEQSKNKKNYLINKFNNFGMLT